jgi:hypothetical protein
MDDSQCIFAAQQASASLWNSERLLELAETRGLAETGGND